MDSGEAGLGHGLVKFQAVTRQNAVLVVAAKPELLQRAQRWIARLDAPTADSAGVKVFKLRYGDAKQVAKLLNVSVSWLAKSRLTGTGPRLCARMSPASTPETPIASMSRARQIASSAFTSSRFAVGLFGEHKIIIFDRAVTAASSRSA